MEFDVTDFVSDPHRLWCCAHSAAEGGPTAGSDCWADALDNSDEYMFVTPENTGDVRDWLAGFGAWDLEEIAAMSDREANAMLLQFIAGDARRRADAVERGELERWEECEGGRLYEGGAGTSSGRGRFYFYVGM